MCELFYYLFCISIQWHAKIRYNNFPSGTYAFTSKLDMVNKCNHEKHFILWRVLLFWCSNVAGFIYVTDVDTQRFQTWKLFQLTIYIRWLVNSFSNCHFRNKITYLAPSAGDLPSRFLIVGSLTWIENWVWLKCHV